MKKIIQLQDKVIVSDPNDNIATARVEIEAGIILSREVGNDITLRDKIPFGHKLALEPIAQGEPVLKYGQRIGIATRDIVAGDLVHVDNLAGERGRN
jgi:altronate dehydratase small subunit